MLRQLPNLTQLELRVLGASLTDILFDCPFSLQVFSCDTCDPRPLHDFLVRQSKLAELHLATQSLGHAGRRRIGGSGPAGGGSQDRGCVFEYGDDKDEDTPVEGKRSKDQGV
ncbi:hypothetical protein FRC08_016686 [Ceratobasidium sp. 394]|nr:hypothetical protein FRC08_016686 [Ceratobasidium sp. 394]